MAFEPVWDSLIAWYLFLAGLGAGAYISSVWLHWKCPGTDVMVRFGRIIAPAAVCIGILLLIFDARGGLYNPLRFTLLLSNFASVMTWGVVFLGSFTLVALVTLVLDLAKKAVPRWLEGVGSALAVCVAMYTGALLGVCATFPLWNNALLPLLFLVSGLSAGAAAVLGFGSAATRSQAMKAHSLKLAHWVCLIVEMAMLACLLFVTSFNSTAGFNSVQSLTSGQFSVLFWLVLVVIGLVFPVIVDAIVLFSKRHGGEGADGAGGPSLWRDGVWPLLADLGVLAGGFTLRYLVITAALPVTMVVSYF